MRSVLSVFVPNKDKDLCLMINGFRNMGTLVKYLQIIFAGAFSGTEFYGQMTEK